MYYKCIGGISSMQEMTRAFNDETVVNNLYRFFNRDTKDFLPHGVTENEFLEKLNPEELEKIQQKIVYSMIRRKTFNFYANHVEEVAGKTEIMNVFEYEYKTRNKHMIRFQWVTSLELAKKNLEEMIYAGRGRWKIENEGFNNQKNGLY